MTAEKLGKCVPESGRQQLIETLVTRKLLKVVKTAIAEVRLTAKGKAFLRNHKSKERSSEVALGVF